MQPTSDNTPSAVDSSPGQTYIQVEGSGYRIKAEALKEAFDRPGAMQKYLHKYIQGFMIQSAYNSFCNRHHEIAQRLARWLLTCHDRIQKDRMPLTHEFLGLHDRGAARYGHIGGGATA